MFLDFAEDNARRRKQVFLADWKRKLDEFLKFNEREVLQGAGSVKHEVAVERANAEYELFAARRREAAEAAGLAELEAAGRDVVERRKKSSAKVPKAKKARRKRKP